MDIEYTPEELEKKIEKLEAELLNYKRRCSFLIAALENLPNPIFMKNEEAKFLFFNKRYSELFGMKRSDYIGKTVLDLEYLPREERVRFQKEDEELIRTSSILSYETDFHFADDEIHPSYYWSRGIYDPENDQLGLVGEIVDITNERKLRDELNKSLEDLRKVNLKLERITEIDPGTGVFNRTLLAKLPEQLKHEEGETSAALMIDLDHFKHVNDTFGHLAGDALLDKFSEILKEECRAEDFPIRYGGDEFLLVLSDATLDMGKNTAERIRRRCEADLKLPDNSTVTASIGVIELQGQVDIEDVIRRLDRNVYEAKNRGRNQVVTG